MKLNQLRAIISTLLIISALLSASTGVVLYFVDYGMWLCFTRKFINDVHAMSALIMSLSVTVHFIINQRMYRNELKSLWNRKRSNNNNYN